MELRAMTRASWNWLTPDVTRDGILRGGCQPLYRCIGETRQVTATVASAPRSVFMCSPRIAEKCGLWRGINRGVQHRRADLRRRAEPLPIAAVTVSGKGSREASFLILLC